MKKNEIYLSMKALFCLGFFLLYSLIVWGHQYNNSQSKPSLVEEVDPQLLLAQSEKVVEALSKIGSGLPSTATKRMEALQQQPHDQETVEKVQEILDPYSLAVVDIYEGTDDAYFKAKRMNVTRGPAKPILQQEGWSTFLVKVRNRAQTRKRLEAVSPNALPILHRSTYGPRTSEENKLSAVQIANRFLEVVFYRNPPLQPKLSGSELEYAVLQIYTREQGKRTAKLGFEMGNGQGKMKLENAIDIEFDIQPAIKVVFDVKDEDNRPTIASFIITDGIERFESRSDSYLPSNYRIGYARTREFEKPVTDTLSAENRVKGIYPLPSRRLATKDSFPDFFFQPQIYRRNGEYVYLPPGKYNVQYSKGPEYRVAKKEITVPESRESIEINFRLDRWINMSERGWMSYDHHIHASGCSHYESPEGGVRPGHLWRQIQGEDLKMGSVLNWGPNWYHQKQFFSGHEHPHSNQQNIMRYDLEISGFPSGHAGHLVLLNMQEDNYPNTTKIEQWPSWTLPILEWADTLGAKTGYPHSGWGLAPVKPTVKIPNYVTPEMDGIGANEFVVTVTHDVVDFLGIGDTPVPSELNMWYHTLNSGFKTKISGESDFPCIYDERVGTFRTYAKTDLDFSSLMKEAMENGRSYVSDGYTHLIDFTVNGKELGEINNELALSAPATLDISVKATAMLPENQDEIGALIASRKLDQRPYWHIERARIGTSREIPVELIVNGEAVEKQEISADGNWNDLKFDYKIEESSWVTVRVFPSAHTNPIFVIIDEKPIRNKKSVVWLLEAVDKAWEMKSVRIRENELDGAREAYDYARNVYKKIIQEIEK